MGFRTASIVVGGEDLTLSDVAGVSDGMMHRRALGPPGEWGSQSLADKSLNSVS